MDSELIYRFLSAMVLAVVVFAHPHVASGQTTPLAAQDPDTLRESFVMELDQNLFGSSNLFWPVGTNGVWQGIALALPGTSLSSLQDAPDADRVDLDQTLRESSAFDRPVTLYKGQAAFTDQQIGDIWAEVLNLCTPSFSGVAFNKSTIPAEQWLFKAPDDVDEARGIPPLRGPSSYYIRYLSYESLMRELTNAQNGELWRLDPQLSGYVSKEEAVDETTKQWIEFGYKEEIDSALHTFLNTRAILSWQAWTLSNAIYQYNSTPIDMTSYRQPATYFVPSPDIWGQSVDWRRYETHVPGTNEPVTYQIALIAIQRPWLDLNSLLSRKIDYNAKRLGAANYTLSDGTNPTFTTFPEGVLPAYVTDLIIVRSIHLEDSPDSLPLSLHPLSIFAFPDSINLLGYVVNVLPRTP